MQRGSDKHGPRLDEQLEKETRGMVQGARETRAEEWKSAEPSGEDQPEVDLNPDGALHGGIPEGLTGEDVERRAELASYLGKEIWPAEGSTVKQALTTAAAPDWLRALVTSVPDGRVYDNVAEVWYDLTGRKEQHRF
ncbi:MAG: hypothetical protein ABR549_07950 [Mycobacteriales bacterium]